VAQLSVSEKQQEFLTSEARVVALVCGIGFGKSFIASEKAAQLVANGGHVVAMSQSYKQLDIVLMQEIQERLRGHGIEFKYNKQKMIIDVPATGGKVFGFSADSVESLRGVTADCAILDEAALFDKYCYDVVTGRLRRGILPYQVFITTTPRGRDNWVFDMCQRASTHYIQAATWDNPFLPKDYIAQLMEEYEGAFKAQELEGSFVDMELDDQLISLKELRMAIDRIPFDSDEPMIAGLDVARFGNDTSAFVIRKGNEIPFKRYVQNSNLVHLKQKVIEWVIDQGPETLVVDGVGVGAGMVDELKAALSDVCKIVEFNGSFAARRADKYANLRTETWVLMRDWIRDKGSLPNGAKTMELANVIYLADTKGRMQLESKDQLRRKNKPSPDFGDALSMTFGTHASRKDIARTFKRITKFKSLGKVFAG